MEVLHKPAKQIRKQVPQILSLVGISDKADKYPNELAGGEQQRVAIARALAHRPSMIFADEPTAELDSAMAAKVTEIFREMTRREGITILMTTHDVGLMGAADMTIELSNGEKVIDDQ